ncbi:hypothetical protein GYMLUDRAFT_51512 [Collybiopsis luxurians FD-317 M1]|uniref:Uncharacterized protein n=1 Tax=Collybiopsis luxurians FD-317 M1 TaxID=944289 RepID=A0A0D0B6X2_9AGAR|nr:hypothetical protein GYMLUDRAFT_51512 [Collybiopsis luxurians FD-317 M1]
MIVILEKKLNWSCGRVSREVDHVYGLLRLNEKFDHFRGLVEMGGDEGRKEEGRKEEVEDSKCS